MRSLDLDTWKEKEGSSISLWNDHGLLHILAYDRSGVGDKHVILDPEKQRELRKFMEKQI